MHARCLIGPSIFIFCPSIYLVCDYNPARNLNLSTVLAFIAFENSFDVYQLESRLDMSQIVEGSVRCVNLAGMVDYLVIYHTRS